MNKTLLMWIGLAILFIILHQANKNKEEKANAIGGRQYRASGVSPCFCNGNFMGYMNRRACRRGCRKAVKFGTL